MPRSERFWRVEKAGVLAHGCSWVGGRLGGGGPGRALGSQEAPVHGGALIS